MWWWGQLTPIQLCLGVILASGHYIMWMDYISMDFPLHEKLSSVDTGETSKKRGLFKMFNKSAGGITAAGRSLGRGQGPVTTCVRHGLSCAVTVLLSAYHNFNV